MHARLNRLVLLTAITTAVISVATASGCGGTGGDHGSATGGFGTGGKVRTEMQGADRPVALAIQNDGKLVVSTNAFDLLRYTGRGRLDPSFGNGGKVDGGSAQSPTKGGSSLSSAMAIQRNGKIVVAGFITFRHLADFLLARYTPQGQPDPSFGKAGKVQTHLVRNPSSVGYSSALAIQRDGKILDLSGHSGDGTDVLVRYTASGRLDPSFGRGGKIFTRVRDRNRAIALQDDGKIIVAGTHIGDDPHGFVLARYTSDGKLDPSFGSGGLALTAPFRRPAGEPEYRGPAGEAEFVNPVSVAIRPDGKIVVVGKSESGIALARFGADGRLDPSFGRGGTTNDDPHRRFHEPYYGVYAAALQPDGKIVSVGVSGVPPSDWKTNFVLARHHEDGELDTSFGDGGSLLASLGPLSYATAVAIQRDGKIVAAGKGELPVALARFMRDGRLDS